MRHIVIKDDPTHIDGLMVCQDFQEMKEEMIKGNKVLHWEYGDSLFPVVQSGEYITVEPVKSMDEIELGDVVFCSMMPMGYPLGMKVYTIHMVTSLSKASHDGTTYFKIGDTYNGVMGWTNEIYGKCKGTNMFHGNSKVF